MTERTTRASQVTSPAPRAGTAATGSRRHGDERRDTPRDRGGRATQNCNITSVIHATSPAAGTGARLPPHGRTEGRSRRPRPDRSPRLRLARRHSITAARPPLRLHVLGPIDRALAAHPQVRDNPPMDPLVIALAQLVRERWANEQRARRDRRARLRVVGSDPS